MKKLYIFLILTTLLMARPSLTILPYYTFTHYNDPHKTSSNTIGYYGALYNFPYLLELSASYNDILYKSSKLHYEQTEITILSSYFLKNKLKLKGGLHFVASDFRAANEGLVATIAGLDYHSKKKELGISLYHSHYRHYKPKSLSVFQINPHFSYNFAYFELSANYNYIHVCNNKFYSDIYANYHSFGLNLSKKWGSWSASLGGWIGKRAFALEDNGFTLYNLSQLYTSGLDAKLIYHTRHKADIAIKYSHKKYINYSKKGYSDAITSSFAYKW